MSGLSGIKGSSGVVKDSRCMQGCPGGKGCPGDAGLSGIKGSSGVVKGSPERCRGRDVSLPAVTTKAPGSKDRGARVCVSGCYAIHRRQHWLSVKVV